MKRVLAPAAATTKAQFSSRQALLSGGAGLAALAGPAWAQPRADIAADGFRVLRAGPVSPVPPDGSQPLFAHGYGGQSPGPTLRLKVGEELRVRLINDL